MTLLGRVVVMVVVVMVVVWTSQCCPPKEEEEEEEEEEQEQEEEEQEEEKKVRRRASPSCCSTSDSPPPGGSSRGSSGSAARGGPSAYWSTPPVVVEGAWPWAWPCGEQQDKRRQSGWVANQPVCGQPQAQAPQVGRRRRRRVLIQVPPQGDLGRGEACVVGQRVGHPAPQVARPPVGGRRSLVVQRHGGQVAGEQLPAPHLGAGPIEARRDARHAVDRQLGAEAVEQRRGRRGRQAQLGGVGCVQALACGVQALPVGGAVARAVGLELEQLLLPLALLQLHDADLRVGQQGAALDREHSMQCKGARGVVAVRVGVPAAPGSASASRRSARRSACFSFSRDPSRHREPQSSLSSSHRAFSWGGG
ncbi:hypothetical protein CRUP_031041 [Coryphaenoides rupestris]|nr:hypothetical protein CRUP_031041 [Coryphaenoides rupestris]